MRKNDQVIARVSEIYKWIDEQLGQNPAAGLPRPTSGRVEAGACSACGKCCDFEAFGHRLFVTTPEMIYFADKTGGQKFKQMTTGRCSYQHDSKCTVYKYRFAGCRIFSCKGNVDFQSELTEAVVRKFKDLCEKFKIPYQYAELPTACQAVIDHLK